MVMVVPRYAALFIFLFLRQSSLAGESHYCEGHVPLTATKSPMLQNQLTMEALCASQCLARHARQKYLTPHLFEFYYDWKQSCQKLRLSRWFLFLYIEF